MICACSAIMPHISICRRETDDRLPDLDRAHRSCCHRRIGGIAVSAEIIQFIARPKRDDPQSDFPTIVFRAALPEPAVDPVAAAPDKHAGPLKRET
jgi:hypothetical protein